MQGSLTWFLKLQKLFPKLVFGSSPWKGRTGSIQFNFLQFLTLLTTPSGKPSSTFAPLTHIPAALCKLSSCSFSASFMCSFFSVSPWNVYSRTFQLFPLLWLYTGPRQSNPQSPCMNKCHCCISSSRDRTFLLELWLLVTNGLLFHIDCRHSRFPCSPQAFPFCVCVFVLGCVDWVGYP